MKGKEIAKRILLRPYHVWCKRESLVKRAIEKGPTGKRPLERPELTWKDCAKKKINKIRPKINWREAAKGRNER